ncbi:MAG: type II secretion system F family protein [Candidatus Brocadiia bacterium]|jgi:type IV pilus assembly protein PilC
MPTFTFAAVDEAGKSISGVRAAATRQEVISRLRAENFVVTSVAEESAAGASDAKSPGRVAAAFESVFGNKVKQADLMIFSRQFAAMLKAGISLTDALHTISHSVNNPLLRQTLQTVRTDVQRGQSLTEAMRRHRRAFDPLFLSIVHAGETSGSLAQNVTRLSLYLQRREGFRLKLRAATAYPKFVVVFFSLLTGGIFLFLIPKFNDLFKSFGAKLPKLTATVMNMSLFMKHYFLIILPVLIVLIVTLLVLRRTPKGGALVDRYVLKIPFFGPLFLHAAVARLAMTLSTLLSNGLPLTDALEIATGTMGNAVLEEGCQRARKDVMSGSSLAESLSRVEELPRLLPRMVRVGEEAGTLSSMLEDVASYYDQEVDYALGRIAVVIEPVLICGMGAVVLVVVIAVYLPIFSIGQMMGGH